MRKWICCTCQIEDSNEEQQLKSSQQQSDANHKNPKPAPVAKHEVKKEALPIEVPPLSLDEVKEKTENFGSKALIGEGSYGRVYYATLNDGVAVALKKLDVAPEAESDAEFLSQVSMVSRLNHENLIQLLGFCVDGNLRVLAYEFATMGSLHDILHGRKGVQGAQPGPTLDWITRVKIAVEAARGLEYLHEKSQPPVIHRDIRSSNVLLFEDYKAKIADFNLSNQAPDNAARLHSTRVLGTFGTIERKEKTKMSLVWLEAMLPLGIIGGMLCIMGNSQYYIHKAYHGRPKHIGHDEWDVAMERRDKKVVEKATVPSS